MARHQLTRVALFLAGLALWQPPEVLGCATCFGKSDSPLAQGMNMGIVSLLIMVGVVLTAVAAFFVFLARRSAQLAGRSGAVAVSESINRS